MARSSLVLYLDVVSPFAYLAFHVVTVSEPNSPYSDESCKQRHDLPIASVWLSMSMTGSTIKMSGFLYPFIRAKMLYRSCNNCNANAANIPSQTFIQ